jgi:transposase-like protein
LAEVGRWRVEVVIRRHRTAQGLARRAQIVLAAAEGLENKQIAARVGSDPTTVGKWRRRFAERRLDGLCDKTKPSQIPALDRTQPLLPLRPGQAERRRHDDKRHGTTSLFAALDAAMGRIIGRCCPRHRAQAFLKLLRAVDAELTTRQIRRGVPRSLRGLEDAIQRYIATVNHDPKPFPWIRSADAILASIQRSRTRTLDAAHQQSVMATTSESGR